MKRISFLLLAGMMCLSLTAGSLLAQEGTAKIVRIADEGGPEAGRMVIEDYTGPLPDTPRASRAISQMPGWPIAMGKHQSFAPSRGIVFADLDNDGLKEIIASSTDKLIYAWDLAGNPRIGFPKNTIEMPQYAPTVGDLDHDGDLEIVQFTRGLTSGGRLYAIDHLGQDLPGFPVSINNNNLAGSPGLYDLDNDGDLEILVPERAYPLGILHIFEKDGTEWATGNWPVTMDHVPTGTPGFGDLDGDGQVEIVYYSYNSIYCLEADGSDMPGWPKQISNCNFSYQSPALADLDGDGDLEIVVGAHKNAAGCYVFHHDGMSYPGWPKLLGTWTYCPPTVTDLEGDGVLDILDGRAGGVSPPSNAFWAWTHQGAVKSGFPFVSYNGGGSEGPLTVADIDGDGDMEIFADSNMMVSNQGFLYGVDHQGNELTDFPIRTDGFTYMNGAAIGDVDGDGDFELGVVSYTDYTAWVNLYDLTTGSSATPKDAAWPLYHYRNLRGGNLGSDPKLNARGQFALGSSMDIIIHDASMHNAFLFLSLATNKLYSGRYGWFYIDMMPPFPLALLYNVSLGATGEYLLPVTVPNDPGLQGVTFYFQGVVGADPYNGDGCVTNLLPLTAN